jgi:hypothetical protein
MRDDRPARCPAELFDMAFGPVLLLIGVVGFIASATFDTDRGSDLIIFEVNAWHNLVHIASGLFLLWGAVGGRRRARLTALAFGVVYGLVTLVGWIDGHDVFGLFPVDTADNVLHTVLSAAAIVCGVLTSKPTLDERLHMTSPGRPVGA